MLVCVCVCVCLCLWIREYVFVHTSHLHGAMPHRFHWGVWEQRLSISSAAVPPGKSLIIISWMMSLCHAPRSRPVASSLQHPSRPFSLFSPFSPRLPLFLFLAFSFYSLSFICVAYCSSFISPSPLSIYLPPLLPICLYHSFSSFNSNKLNVEPHSICLSLSLFFLLVHLTCPFFFVFHFIWSCRRKCRRFTANCRIQDQTKACSTLPRQMLPMCNDAPYFWITIQQTLIVSSVVLCVVLLSVITVKSVTVWIKVASRCKSCLWT